MTAADTGHGTHAVSASRLSYWEAWTRWHIAALRAGRKPVMPAAQTPGVDQRPFAVP